MIPSRKQGAATLLAGLGLTLGAAAAVPEAHAAGPVAGAVTAERLKLPSGPSSVRGLADEPTVDPFYGQIGYSVPIEVPEGLGKLAPALSLTYSGALGNGALGIGWTMPGGRIERSQRLGVPSFTDADELEISGPVSGRLVLVSGGGGGSAEYRVEGMGQTVRVRKVGAGFEVDLGNGTRLRFGTTAAARQEASASRTLGWLLEEETNLSGERVAYTYQQHQGQVYLSRVAWGPGQVYAVEATYAARPDATTSYREGFKVVTAQRMDRLRVLAFGAERRAYQLHYDNTFSVSRLAQVTSTGRGGAGSWPALTFDYAQPAAPAVAPMPGVGTWRLNANGITLVDLDGDGASELLQLADGGHSYRVNQNGSFGASLPLTGNSQSITSLQLQDIDGDARVDLLQDTGTGWAVWKWTKTKWMLQALPGGVWPGSAGLALKNPSLTRYADLNGDGLVDAIKWDNDNLKIYQATTTGIAAPREVPRIGGAVLPSAAGRFQDENGDGLDDYLVLQSDRLDVYTGRGDGTFEPVVARAYPFTGAMTNPADIHLVDLNRDDLLDLVRVDLGTVRWFRGKPAGAFETAPVLVNNPESLSADVVVTIADVNGNGSQDVVWSSTTNMWSMDLVGPTTAGMLVRTRNGLGLDVAFAYRSAHAISVDARAAADPWQYELPIAMPVPVRKTTALGAGEATRQIDYLVRDGYWDAAERRFGGFLGTIVTTWGATPAQTSSVQTRYHNGAGANRQLRGKPLVEQVRNGSGVRLSMTINTWEAMLVSGLPDTPQTRKAVLRESRTRYEDVAPIRESRTTYEYDVLGRARRAVDYGRLDLAGDDSVRETRYTDDATTWVRDALCEDKVTDLAGAVASHVQIFFGDEAAVHPLCVVGKGWERERKRWLAGEARWVTQSAASYDARGNVISSTSDGVTRAIGYDATGLFPVSEQVDLGGGQTLAWSVTWDQVLGLATELTDASGQKTRARYDALGRTIGYALGAQPDHLVIAYDWSAAFPKTTVFEFDGAPAALGALPGSWTPTGKWRQSVEVSNGKGEVRYRAQRLDTASWIISDYRERDPAGRVVFTGQPVLSAQLELAARPAGITGQTLTYDPLGRLLEQRLPTGASRTYTYASFERTVREDAQAQVRHILDGKGRIVTTERQAAGGGVQKVEARYDAAGRMTQMLLQDGAVVRDFTYDTLGRLTSTRDPDIGLHVVRYDDAGRVVEERNGMSQAVTYTYDAAGRLATRDSGQLYRYHYDAPRPGVTLPPGVGNLAGRLAWVEEPTGLVELGYDAAGRASWARRQIDGRTAEESTAYSASGLVLGRSFDDGLALTYGYDPAGRILSVRDAVGELWRVASQDAAGRILEERFKNGAVSRFGRDALGLVSRVEVKAGNGASLYDVAVQRTLWSGISAVTDNDGAGLDHSATFGYDDFARLTSATVGRAATGGQYSFSYAYDGLQNMTARTAAGPTALGVFTGAYRYAESGAGPRQLTSILGAGGQVHTFGYDAAGRQIAKDGMTLQFDALDQLQQVSGLPGGAQVTHAYGYDGLRVKTTTPAGVSYWFSETLSERGDVREHDIVVGDRVVARVAYRATTPLAQAARSQRHGGAAAVLGAVVPKLPLAAGALLVGWALLGAAGRGRSRRGRFTRLGAAFTATTLITGSCSTGSGGGEATRVSSLSWTLHSEVYFHVGVGAGPALFTDAAGRLLEERRYEPFGEEIDANLQNGSGGYAVGAPDLVARDLNSLNKRTEVTTGWSYHGARWMAPETGRWLTADPPVKTPSTTQLRSPWGLHPYQYVDQNPVRYWDPDGHDKAVLLYIGMGDHAADEAAALTKQVGARGTVIAITPDDGTSSVIKEGGASYDLSSDNEQFAFAQAVAPAAKGWLGVARRNVQVFNIYSVLKNADEDTRNEIAAVVSAYSRAERGEINIERVVISGHHYEDDDEIWGDGGASMNLSMMAQLAQIFPASAGGVKDMGFSACNTLVDADDLAVVKSMFPALDTAWGYKDTCPGTWNGAIEHLKKWEKATRGNDSSLTGREARGIRKGGNVRVENFE